MPEPSASQRVVLTGGTGFVGANLARRLLREGHEVHLLVRPGYATWRIDAIRARIRLHELDLSDAGAVGRAIDAIAPVWAFHLAAHGAYSWQNDLAEMVRTNIVGTMNLVQACARAGVAAFVNAGSSSEYGFKAHPPPETECPEPNSHYAVTKAAATLFCRHTAQREQRRIVTLRLYSAYGPYEEPKRLIPTLIREGLAGRFPPLVDPAVARDFVYVDDVCDAFLLAAGAAGVPNDAVYNLGTGVQTTIGEAVAVARSVLGIAAEPKWASMANRSWDTSTWIADSARIRRELGWAPRHTFEQGFRATVEWTRTGGDLVHRGTHVAATSSKYAHEEPLGRIGGG